jgi:hypothetical protein
MKRLKLCVISALAAAMLLSLAGCYWGWGDGHRDHDRDHHDDHHEGDRHDER